MNSIRSVLRHRCKVRRGTTTNVGGVPTTTWSDVAENVPCLLDAGTPQLEPLASQTQQQTADRSGILFTSPNSVVRPADRITLTRGGTGTFVVKPDPSQIFSLNGPSHAEFRVEEVPGS